ncbi:hypothetical protein [Paractinoplanes ferrugineus]
MADPASLGADEELLLKTMLSVAVGADKLPGRQRPGGQLAVLRAG